jgi:hypothetical protein
VRLVRDPETGRWLVASGSEDPIARAIVATISPGS